MKLAGKHYMSLGLMAFTAYVVITALKWPMKTALFPLAIGIPVFFMAFSLLLLDLFGKEDKKGAGSQALDFKLSQSEDQELTNKRTLEIFLWILGFFFLIQLVGFSLSVPIFFIGYMRFKSKESWMLTLILSAIAWAFFYGLFIWLLDTPFMDGWIQRGLQALGILS
jgi:hypothetical protein